MRGSSWRTAAGAGVARVGEARLSFLCLPFVHFLELAAQHVGLAAHFEKIDGGFAECERNRLDSAQVGGDVLATAAVVLPRSEATQVKRPASCPGKRDGETVDLGLAHAYSIGESAARPRWRHSAVLPFGQFVVAAHVLERDHGGAMGNFDEAAFEQRRADALGSVDWGVMRPGNSVSSAMRRRIAVSYSSSERSGWSRM